MTGKLLRWKIKISVHTSRKYKTRKHFSRILPTKINDIGKLLLVATFLTKKIVSSYFLLKQTAVQLHFCNEERSANRAPNVCFNLCNSKKKKFPPFIFLCVLFSSFIEKIKYIFYFFDTTDIENHSDT